MPTESTRAARHFVSIARRYGVPNAECWERIIEIATDRTLPGRTQLKAIELLLAAVDPLPSARPLEDQWAVNRRRADWKQWAGSRRRRTDPRGSRSQRQWFTRKPPQPSPDCSRASGGCFVHPSCSEPDRRAAQRLTAAFRACS